MLATEAAVEGAASGAKRGDAAVVARNTRRHRAVLLWDRRGRILVIRTADGGVTTIDGRETAPAAMRPDSSGRPGGPLPFEAARFSGLGRRARDRALVGRRWALRHDGLTEALRPAIELAREGSSYTRPSLLRPDLANASISSTTSPQGGDLPRLGRHSPRRRHRASQPRPRPTYERLRTAAPKVLSRRESPMRW